MITTLLLISIQSFNSILEIAFLYNHIEENSIKKYRHSGKVIKQKLEKSISFGKQLETLDFNRLLKGIIPTDIENFYILNADKKVLFQPFPDKGLFKSFYEDYNVTQKKRSYLVTIPLENKKATIGNIVIVIPDAQVRSRLYALIKEAVVNFMITIGIILPILYIILIIYIDRPYTSRIKKITKKFQDREYDSLSTEGIELKNLMAAEALIDHISTGNWLKTDAPAFGENNNDLSAFIESLNPEDKKSLEKIHKDWMADLGPTQK